MSELTIAPLAATDWVAVRAIYAAGIATGHATFETEPPSWATFDAAKLSGHRHVARGVEGTVLGWVAAAATSDRYAYAGVVEHSLYVDPAAHGRGVGRALISALIASTEAAGLWTIQSGVFPENAASLALHRSAGFRPVGRRERIARMEHGPAAGQWRDVVLLERRSPVVGA